MVRATITGPICLCLLAAALAVPLLLGGCPPTPPDGTDLTGDFVGADACMPCHSNIHSNWTDTLHAGAFETLEAIGQAGNPNCVRCHVTGFGKEGGFVDLATTGPLAGVQCEACHGPSRPHVMNVSDESLRPPLPLASEVCGECHQTENYPHYPDWVESAHSLVTETPAEDFAAGEMLSVCGVCHSGDYRFGALIVGESVPGDRLVGVPREEQHAVECVICHDPHERTGLAAAPDPGRDFQLRYREAAFPEASNSVATITDPTRYNVCGQCHHSRGRDWTSTSRGPHESIQANVYIGEMPMPAGQQNDPLAPNTRSVHRFVPAQCATCHMFRQETPSPFAPPIADHHFEIVLESCSSATGCHPTPEIALADTEKLQTEVADALAEIAARLGDPSTWQYSGEGGPQDQTTIPAEIKKVRFLYAYVRNDGSLGVHNPPYVRLMLAEADALLDGLGK